MKNGQRMHHINKSKSHTSTNLVSLDHLVFQSRGAFKWQNLADKRMLCRGCNSSFKFEYVNHLNSHCYWKKHSKLLQNRLSTSSLGSQFGRRSSMFAQKRDRHQNELDRRKILLIILFMNILDSQ